MNISIRHATVEDAPSIVSAEQELAKTPGYFCSNPSELSAENVKITISNISQKGNGIYLVAEHERQIVGHGFLEQLELQSLYHVAELTIVVHQEWQEKGIGKKLMQELIEWAKNSPTVEKIELNVRATNTRAISLYKRMGFREEGRLKNRVKVGNKYIDDLIMALDVRQNTFMDTCQQKTSFQITPALPSELETLDKAITDYNITVASELPLAEIHRLDFCAKNQSGDLLGGIQAMRVNWGILEIELLFVFEQYRHLGIASQLLKHVENIARENNCHIAHLDTFDFQAKDFYLKQGYTIFGTLNNAPKGHCRCYMKKEL